MTLEDLLPRLVSALESAQVPYMLTGSVASSAHGRPRSTCDLDIVISTTRAQLTALIEQFPSSRYYADEQQALQALSRRSQFNVIDYSSGWKVDFIIAEDSDYGREAFGRRQFIEIAGSRAYIASAEDVIIAKLRWAKLGSSERQLQDAADIVITQSGNLDLGYLERWISNLQLEEEWKVVRNF